MAIKMDGNVITELLLKASDGTEVSKALTEEYSGSGVSQGYTTGYFTPEENTHTYTINTGLSEVHGLCIQYDYATVNTSSGVRVVCSVIADLVSNIICSISSTASGSAMNSVGYNDRVTVTTDEGNAIVTARDNYFVPMLYRWYAW